jgi:hypothetical protein
MARWQLAISTQPFTIFVGHRIFAAQPKTFLPLIALMNADQDSIWSFVLVFGTWQSRKPTALMLRRTQCTIPRFAYALYQ